MINHLQSKLKMYRKDFKYLISSKGWVGVWEIEIKVNL